MHHTFYDDHGLLDLRFLAGVETFDWSDDDDPCPEPFGIGCLLEVGHTPQRLSFTYATRPQRDQALDRLIAAHQAWEAWTHAPHEG